MNHSKLDSLADWLAGRHFSVAAISTLRLHPHSPLKRDLPEAFIDAEQFPTERYDFTNLFYDIFRLDRDRVCLSGPPLMNLKDILLEAHWVDIVGSPTLQSIRRAQRSSVATRSSELTIVSPHLKSEPLLVQPSGRHLFRGKRALVTISKNNDLTWIRDWAQFYARTHGVNAVVIYDNGSDAYSPEALLDALKDVKELRTGIVVPWRFPFGVQRIKPTHLGPDGNYAQATMLEHARWRYLADAALVISVDVDEYVVTEDNKSLDHYVRLEGNGVGLEFPGRWISAVSNVVDKPRAQHFRYYLPEHSSCGQKWCVVPAKIPDECQWTVHRIFHHPLPTSDAVMHRHFRALSTSWFRNRKLDEAFTSRHLVDGPLVEALTHAFPFEGES